PGRRLVFVGVVHALLEALDRLAQVASGAAQALGAEDEEHDHQHDDPMPDAETAHSCGRNSGVVGWLRIPQAPARRVARARRSGSVTVVERLAADLALAHGLEWLRQRLLRSGGWGHWQRADGGRALG